MGKSALLVIDIQQKDFVEMDESNMDVPEQINIIGL